MARQLRPLSTEDMRDIEQCIEQLKLARNAARRAGARQTHKAVCRALKSAEGALRHADRIEHVQYRRAAERALAVLAKGVTCP